VSPVSAGSRNGYGFGGSTSKTSRGFAASFQLPVGRLQWPDEWPLVRFQRTAYGFDASASKTSLRVLARTWASQPRA